MFSFLFFLNNIAIKSDSLFHHTKINKRTIINYHLKHFVYCLIDVQGFDAARKLNEKILSQIYKQFLNTQNKPSRTRKWTKQVIICSQYLEF